MRQHGTGVLRRSETLAVSPPLEHLFHIAQELWHLSRIAKGAALSATLGRHQIYSHALWQ